MRFSFTVELGESYRLRYDSNGGYDTATIHLSYDVQRDGSAVSLPARLIPALKEGLAQLEATVARMQGSST
jgi:hypothetical protein